MAVFLSLSTGAYLCVFVQIAILIWGKIFKSVKGRWVLLFSFVLFSFIVIDVLSNRNPFEVFVSYLTFNTGSSYNRILIWKFGTANILNHPLFGIGLNDWERPEWMHASMDNFWLIEAVRYGIPAFIFMSSAFLIILFSAGKKRYSDQKLQIIRNSSVISIIGVFFAISSVDLWNATFCWLMFIIGSLAWFKDPYLAQKLPSTRRAIR
jgi:O-antigen ligase